MTENAKHLFQTAQEVINLYDYQVFFMLKRLFEENDAKEEKDLKEECRLLKELKELIKSGNKNKNKKEDLTTIKDMYISLAEEYSYMYLGLYQLREESEHYLRDLERFKRELAREYA